MFVRNGRVAGSILHKDEPAAAAAKPKAPRKAAKKATQKAAPETVAVPEPGNAESKEGLTDGEGLSAAGSDRR